MCIRDSFKVVYCQIVEYIDDGELLNQYGKDDGEHVKKEGALAAVLQRYVDQMNDLASHIKAMHENSQELAKIALSPIPTAKEFLEMLRNNVLQTKRLGYKQKAEQLDALIRQQEYYERYSKQGHGHDEITELKCHLTSAIQVLTTMTRLSVSEFEKARSTRRSYPWVTPANKQVRWTEALEIMLKALEKLLTVNRDYEQGEEEQSSCPLM
eukprot:TRINITY_DN8375_c0_g1_i1.p1 TRINITY_DN8375_c0_g1~~TRINITY_DN8375_c0_g1_i1.p1  ORF type:complete len:211 (+),score=35.85 TRINITY_DN8375_c0_g1_i1:26-658(+)